MGSHAVITLAIMVCMKVLSAEDAVPALHAPPPKTARQDLNSYLPAVMQVLAHLTNQMKYERDTSGDVTTSSTTSTTSTTQDTTSTMSSTAQTEQSTIRSSTFSPVDETTPIHPPGNFAPIVPGPLKSHIQAGILTDPEPEILIPPIPSPNLHHQGALLLPNYQANIPYTKQNSPQEQPQNFYTQQEYYSFPAFMVPFKGYDEQKAEDKPLFLPGNFAQQNPNYPEWFSKGRAEDSFDSYKPAGEYPDLGSLPLQNENNFKLNPLDSGIDELTEENLQYLAPSVREILEGFHSNKNLPAEVKNNPTALYQSIEDLYDNPNDKKTVGDWLRARKAAVTQTYIQLLLLYDLLSRDAKNQKLNNYHGYTREIQKDLDDVSMGTAAEQLKAVLDRMVARGDCKYDFANNRAKEIATELGKPESKTSMEVRYLKPLRFN